MWIFFSYALLWWFAVILWCVCVRRNNSRDSHEKWQGEKKIYHLLRNKYGAMPLCICIFCVIAFICSATNRDDLYTFLSRFFFLHLSPTIFDGNTETLVWVWNGCDWRNEGDCRCQVNNGNEWDNHLRNILCVAEWFIPIASNFLCPPKEEHNWHMHTENKNIDMCPCCVQCTFTDSNNQFTKQPKGSTTNKGIRTHTHDYAAHVKQTKRN